MLKQPFANSKAAAPPVGRARWLKVQRHDGLSLPLHWPALGGGTVLRKILLGQRMKRALSIGLHGINVDLRFMDMAAFGARQGPVLTAGAENLRLK